MEKNIQIILVALLFTGSVFGQAPTIEWSKSLGEVHYGNSVRLTTSDGGRLMASNNPGLITKIDKNYNLIWQTNTGIRTEPNTIRQLNDGSYLIIGWTNSGLVPRSHKSTDCNCYRGDIWIAKLDVNGKLEWQNAYGGSENDFSFIGHQTNDGGYIIFGSVGSNDGDLANGNRNEFKRDIWILKLSKTGEIEWQRTVGGTGYDSTWGKSTKNNDGTFTMTGETDSKDGDFSDNVNGYSKCELIFNENGDLIKKQYFEWLVPTEKVKTNDGNFIATGVLYTVLDGKNTNIPVVGKFNPKGELLWQKTFVELGVQGSGTISEDNDGGYLIGGSVFSVTNIDFLLLKLDNLGNLIWQKTFVATSGNEYFANVFINPDNTYTAVLTSNSTEGVFTKNRGKKDVWVLKIDANGNILEQMNIGGSNDDFVSSVEKIDDSLILFVTTKSTDFDMVENKFSNGTMVFKVSNKSLSTENFTTNPVGYAPNPTTNQLTLTHTEPIKKASVYNYVGQLILTQNGTENTMQLNVSSLAKGNYLVKIESETEVQTVKFVKE